MIDSFIHHYNFVRLHQGIGFVTPAERHDGSHAAIIDARSQGMQRARHNRRLKTTEGAGAVK